MPSSGGSRSARSLELARFAFSMVGYLVFVVMVAGGVSGGIFVPGHLPDHLLAGDVGDVFDAAGNALRNGQAVYTYVYPPYFYAPPITVVFAAISWLPVPITYALVTILNVAGLRYLAGSWRRLGYLLWIVLIPFELALGNINLLLAASVVAAVRSDRTAVPAILAFAKFSPTLAVNPRLWRSFALWIIIGIAITLPWWWLWPQWLEQMRRAWESPVGSLIAIPFLIRLPIGLALVATRTRLGRVTGAVIATPAFYVLSFVMLTAPISILFDLYDEGRFRLRGRSSVASPRKPGRWARRRGQIATPVVEYMGSQRRRPVRRRMQST
jgi:hypothetical protein